MDFKLENANEIIMQIPKVSYGYIDNKTIIEELNKNFQGEKVALDNMLIYCQEILESSIDWIHENMNIEFDPFNLPSFLESYSIGTEKEVLFKNSNQYYNYIGILSDIATNITFVNMIADYYTGIGKKIKKQLINNKGLADVLLDINSIGLEQGRNNIIDLDSIHSCSYIIL